MLYITRLNEFKLWASNAPLHHNGWIFILSVGSGCQEESVARILFYFTNPRKTVFPVHRRKSCSDCRAGVLSQRLYQRLRSLSFPLNWWNIVPFRVRCQLPVFTGKFNRSRVPPAVRHCAPRCHCHALRVNFLMMSKSSHCWNRQFLCGCILLKK